MCFSWLNIEREALAAALHQVMRNVACYAAWLMHKEKAPDRCGGRFGVGWISV